jgi:hypothetical protein
MSKYHNMFTHRDADELPPIRTTPDGWREIVERETPKEDYRAILIEYVELDANTCKIVIAKQLPESQLLQEDQNQAAAQRQSRIDAVELSQRQMLELVIRIHNAKLPAQYKVTADEAKEMVKTVLGL